MSKLPELMNKNRRLAILRFLEEDTDYSLNTSVLQSALRAIGHGVSRDVVEADSAWLAEQGLVMREVLDPVPITVLTITARGVDVAKGMAAHPGIDRPLPRV